MCGDLVKTEIGYDLYIDNHSLPNIPSAKYPWDITRIRLNKDNCDKLFDNNDSVIESKWTPKGSNLSIKVKLKLKWAPKSSYCELCGDGGEYLKMPCDHNDGSCTNWDVCFDGIGCLILEL